MQLAADAAYVVSDGGALEEHRIADLMDQRMPWAGMVAAVVHGTFNRGQPAAQVARLGLLRLGFHGAII